MGLYVDGKLVDEGHDLGPEIDNPRNEYREYDFWMGEGLPDGLPLYLEDLPETYRTV